MSKKIDRVKQNFRSTFCESLYSAYYHKAWADRQESLLRRINSVVPILSTVGLAGALRFPEASYGLTLIVMVIQVLSLFKSSFLESPSSIRFSQKLYEIYYISVTEMDSLVRSTTLTRSTLKAFEENAEEIRLSMLAAVNQLVPEPLPHSKKAYNIAVEERNMRVQPFDKILYEENE